MIRRDCGYTDLSSGDPDSATEHPTATWTDQQVLEAVGLDDAPKYLLHDRDAIYGALQPRGGTANI